MQPRIRYAQTKDGVSIAYSTLGAGPPIVYMGFPLFSHLQSEWGIPELRAFYETIAQDRTLVRYDYRSTGLSDRTVRDMSLDSLVLDLEAVADRLRLERFALFTPVRIGPVGVTYTVRHLERISHLILWNAVASASDYSPTRQIQASLTLAEQDWELFTETYVHLLGGWAGGEGARRAAALAREAITPEGFRAFETAFRDFDVTKLLPKVACPTLVLHHRENPFTGTGAARRLASNIPDARLVLLEGQSLSPHRYIDDTVATFDEFLGEGEAPATVAEPPEPGAFRTVLFTDVEGSTPLTQRLGDAKAREVLREHERMVRKALKSHGGA